MIILLSPPSPPFCVCATVLTTPSLIIIDAGSTARTRAQQHRALRGARAVEECRRRGAPRPARLQSVDDP